MPESITLPTWFGTALDSSSAAEETSDIEVDFVADMTTLANSDFGMVFDTFKLACRLNSSTGEQVLVIDMDMIYGSERSRMIFYARKDNANNLYMKNASASFDGSNNWESGHLSIIKTEGSNFIVRKANQMNWNDMEAGKIYSHCLIGAGSIASDSFISLRWTEAKYDDTSDDADHATILTTIHSNDGTDLYFIINYQTAEQYNDKFVPYYGDYGVHDGPDLSDDLDNSSINGNDYSAFDSHMSLDNLIRQTEIPGYLTITASEFSDWTEN